MLDLGCWLRHTTGEVRRECRDLVMISSLFFGWRRRIDGWRSAKGRMLVGCGSPLDRFDADDFGAGPGRLGLVLILTLGLVSLGAAVGAAAAEFLGGAEDGAVEACFVALEAGQ